ncbi:MAG TPA: RagB/SusD family nutrient uptake outer membrane protein, partial [Anseongella sp.]|nr:RagB/SusD family nutrient uptake outer membrane protein [Anseongella sp.]
MKRFITYMLLSLAVALASCEEFLDQQPISDLSNDKFWLTPGDAELGMAGIYSGVQEVFNTGYIEWGDARSDNFTYSGTGDAQINNSINAVTTTMAETNWSDFYKVIGRANLAIKYLPQIADLPAAERDHYLGQAYALRAYMYFFIVKLWGG